VKRKVVTRISIPIEIYRRQVILFIGADEKTIFRYGTRYKCNLTEHWKGVVKSLMASDCRGFCMPYGDGEADILIWLRKRPKRATEYDTLYHELYHAVDYIADSVDPLEGLRDRENSSEARAYLYSWLATECNRVLWS